MKRSSCVYTTKNPCLPIRNGQRVIAFESPKSTMKKTKTCIRLIDQAFWRNAKCKADNSLGFGRVKTSLYIHARQSGIEYAVVDSCMVDEKGNQFSNMRRIFNLARNKLTELTKTPTERWLGSAHRCGIHTTITMANKNTRASKSWTGGQRQ